MQPRKETLGIGILFVGILLPLLALNAWVAIAVVSKLNSNRISLGLILLSTLEVILLAALAEKALLRLPFLRCLKECFAAGWGFLAPSLFVFFWNLPKERQLGSLILTASIFIIWWLIFWRVFAANTAAMKQVNRKE